MAKIVLLSCTKSKLEKPAPAYKISETQVSACWLQDKDAPDVDGFKKSGGDDK